MLQFSTAESQKELFRKHRAIIRKHDDKRFGYISVKLAILSGVTVHPLKDILEALLLENGFNPEMFEGDYNAYQFEARFSEDLAGFAPDIIYLHSSIDNVTERPEIAHDNVASETVLDGYWSDHLSVVNALLERTNATIIYNSVELPNFRMNGNYEAVAEGGLVRFVNAINARMADLAQSKGRILLNDLNYLAAKVGLENWRDDKSYVAFKQPFTSRAIIEIARSLTSLVRASQGKSGKCLVLDLDNTLWGGIIGDDGVENVEIGNDSTKGEAYLAFQKAIRPLLGRGIGFAVCSKNEEETGRAGLRRDAMHLKEDDFHVLRINWNQKSENIKEIKTTFNVGYDAIYFIDDSEFERSEVGFALPDLNVPDVKVDPFAYIQALSDSYAFETAGISKEDRGRGESFRAMVEFADQSAGDQDISGFLKSLEMQAEIAPVTDATEARVHQLINKTNQFNLTTTRMTAGEVTEFRETGVILTAALRDKNIDYGLISVLWGAVDGDAFELINWVMSCRVFNRRLEARFMAQLCRQLEAQGVTKINARFIPSAKNMPVKDLLSNLGLDEIGRDGDAVNYAGALADILTKALSDSEEIFQ